MTATTLRALTLGVIATASTMPEAIAQEPLDRLTSPTRPVPNDQSLKAGESFTTTSPQLVPTDRASGPIAYIGPDHLKSNVTTFANDTLAKIAQAWCDAPIELPITSLHVSLIRESASGSATMEFRSGKMMTASVVVNAAEGDLLRVIEHEMTHLVIRARCGLDLPRWFDEGCASLSEGRETFHKFRRDLVQNYLVNNRGISFQALFMRSDPPTGDQILPFYAEATTLVKFLRDRAPGETVREKQYYLVRFIRDVMRDGASMEAYQLHVRSYFGFPKVSALQQAWLESLVAEEYQSRR